jgi:hypothetical protein
MEVIDMNGFKYVVARIVQRIQGRSVARDYVWS